MLSTRVYRSTCMGRVLDTIKCLESLHRVSFNTNIISKVMRRNFGVLTVARSDCNFILFEPSQPKTIQLTYRFYSEHIPKISAKREELIKRKDGIPPEYSLIYKVAIHNYVMYGQRAATAGAIALIAAGLSEAFNLLAVPLSERTLKVEEMESTSTVLTFLKNDTDFIVCYIALLCSVMGVQSFVSKFPLRIYHKHTTNEYIAIFVNLLGLPKTYSFAKGEVRKLPISGISPWKDSKFSMKSRTTILLEHYFRLPEDYNTMLEIGKSDSR